MAKQNKRSPRPEKKSSISSPSREFWWGCALVLAVVLVYSPLGWAGFVWDDDSYVTENPAVVGPLGLKEIWTTKAADVGPLTFTTFWFEYRLWGANALGFHLINVLFHCASAVVLWRTLRRLHVPGPWLGSAFWALHPVLVESVAWVVELKNCQSTFFYLLSIFYFVRWLELDERKRKFSGWNYAGTLAFAALAMASKSSTVVLPLVLCLVAWWMERRLTWRSIIAVAPTLLFSVMAGLLAIWTQHTNDSVPFRLEWTERLILAGWTVWFYLGKLIWPYPLLAMYPRWSLNAGDWIEYLPLLAAVACLALLWFKRRTWGRPWFFAFGYFVVALSPVLGLLQFSFMRYSFVADHFQNLACMGPLALAGSGLVCLRDRLDSSLRWLPTAGCVALLLTLGVVSWNNAWDYQDAQRLFTKTVAWNPTSAGARYGLAGGLSRNGHDDEAIAQLRKCLELQPDFPKALLSLGEHLTAKGQLDEAVDVYQRELRSAPNDLKAHVNLGQVLVRMGRTPEAIEQFQAALKLNPNDPYALNNMGVILAASGKLEEAVAMFQQAVRQKPDYAGAQDNLAKAQADLQKKEQPVPAVLK
jgi:tetratricopeptide (TPR) repeat protein